MTADERYPVKVGGESESGTDHWLCIIETLSHLNCWQIRVQALHGTSIVIIAVDNATEDAITGALIFGLIIANPSGIAIVCLLILRLSLVRVSTAYLKWLTLRFQLGWSHNILLSGRVRRPVSTR